MSADDLGDRDLSVLADPAIVARMALGDRDALRALYRRHAGRLIGIAGAIVGERSAEDVVHDVFLEAWRHAADYSVDRGTVQAWLTVRARSRALDRYKSDPSSRSVSIDEVPQAAYDDEGKDAEALSDHARIREALVSLRETEREVLSLGYFEGLTCAEMATRLDLPIGTVKTRVRAGLTALRARLADVSQSDTPAPGAVARGGG